ncbi:redox-sensitive transcriptional activator SoxR [Roseateles sp. BYS180W]|uniref:Redox-sensitive transcriptional activator SoxR n=1 Tax=Roseateles rivi TaxID=3299028 RepID=A0ABW7FSS0_9BURK
MSTSTATDSHTHKDWIAIGDFARRSGVAASTLRFYEDAALLHSQRAASGRRHYRRADLRRVAFIRIAQSLGLSLDDVRRTLASLPQERTPTAADWARLSRQWRPLLDARIAALTQLRDQLDSCIGCGCLSMKKCGLYNAQDRAAAQGQGACYLSSSTPSDMG